MLRSDAGEVSKRVIVVQLIVLGLVLAFLKFYLPRKQKADAAAQVQERESRISQFFNSMAAPNEDSSASNQLLRGSPSVAEVEQALGAPDTSSTDYAGGLHLTWIGKPHNLVASFDHGNLYSLVLTDRSTGQQSLAMKSPQ